MQQKDVEDILSGIDMCGTRFEEWAFAFRVNPIASMSAEGPEGLLLECSFERPDADSGKMGTGWGRAWHLHPDCSEESVVKTAWLAMRQIVEHEMMEAFTYDSVRLFDPHKSIEDLTCGSRTAGGYTLTTPVVEEATEMFAGGSPEGLALTLGQNK